MNRQQSIQSFRLSNAVVRKVAGQIERALDTPISLSCFLLRKYGEEAQLAEKRVDPLVYIDPFRFRDDYLVTSFLRKWRGLDGHSDASRRTAALNSFWGYESLCGVTNRRLMSSLSWRSETILSTAKNYIRRVIGDTPDIQGIVERATWGNGVTSSCKGAEVSRYNKLGAVPECTPALANSCLIDMIGSWAPFRVVGDEGPRLPLKRRLVVVRGSTVSTVPKDAKTDRVIAVEPHLNMLIQRGIGRTLRAFLKRARVDIRRGAGVKNQNAALAGSITGELFTLDLSGASDCISRGIVELLLPPDWYSLLEQVRSKEFTLDGRTYPFRKFSSMGNGFTFELETLLFYAIAKATAWELGAPTRDIMVYGDDIVGPVSIFDPLCEVLRESGFQINQRKSFATSSFRESCGADYYAGVDVRPMYVKESDLYLQDVFVLANLLRDLALRRGGGLVCDRALFVPWRTLISCIPEELRFRVPWGQSGGIWSTLEELEWSNSPFGPLSVRLPFLRFRPARRRRECVATAVASAVWDLEDSTSGPGTSDISQPGWVETVQQPLDRTRYDLRDTGSWRLSRGRFLWNGLGAGWA